ncbi:MAG TPA: adenosylcobinamide-phosphate synthase CbiB, partial [Thermodesulfobacteriota bacterium]|nr:adenosylcobinamide-phosphate synthase CbiB [Thermodesulfobacteriota bacterium]
MSFLNLITHYSLPITIFFAYLLDLILGDPRWLPHPVRWIGRYISFLEDKIRRFATPTAPPLIKGGGREEKIGGIFLFIIVIGTVFGATWFLLYLAYQLSAISYQLLAVFIAYVSLSIKSLKDEALSVAHAVENISVEEARKRLKNIVGRDTGNFSKDEIYRAVTETVAENTSDGIVAPLFYLALGGPALALAYKAVNTLDSMVGYKNEKYKNLGWFSARMDDIVNFIPARITAILMVFASFILRFNWRNSLKIIWRDARKHPSPNAGFPEAAIAGALGLQL